MGAGVNRTGIWAGALSAQLVATVLPPRCPGCATVVEADHRFCAGCWGAMRFLDMGACGGCGEPLIGEEACLACARSQPIDSVRAAVAYGESARALALRLKYGRRMGVAETMARLMQRHLPNGADLIVPVPLHRWRLWTRGYNQAALIGAALSRKSGVAQDARLLRRTRATPPLRGMNGAERLRAVAGAFALEPHGAARLDGAHVVLIDDVYTSGATAGACAAMLKAAGAARVTLLCWARVIHDDTAA